MADLLSLCDYKLIKGISNTNEDVKHEFLLGAVSTLVRTYCGNGFDTYAGSPGKTEVFDVQWDTYSVQLAESPVIAISNVYERLTQSDTYTELFKDGTNGKYEWYFDSLSESVIRTDIYGNHIKWPRGVGAVKVIYTAGYTSIPEDLKLAIADLTTYYAQDEYKMNQTIGASSRQGAPITVVQDSGFPDHIRRVLDLYKEIVI